MGILPLALVALTVFGVLTALASRFTRPGRFWSRLAPNDFIADIYRRVARLVVVIGALVLALDILGATAFLGTVLGAAGLIGLAVGFAVRDTVENFIASVMLSLRQPFGPNDLVDIEGDQGFVLRLSSRATILLSLDGNQIRIPNARVFKARIVNYSAQPERRFEFRLGLDTDADLAAARDIALATLGGLAFVLRDPSPEVWVEEVGDSNVVMTFTAWVDQTRTNPQVARGEAIRVTKTALENAGFGLPEPIYRLRMDGGGMPPGATGVQPSGQPARRERSAPQADLEAVRADETLPRRVAQERAQQATQGDLLSNGPASE